MIGYEQSVSPDGPFGLPILGALRTSVSQLLVKFLHSRFIIQDDFYTISLVQVFF